MSVFEFERDTLKRTELSSMEDENRGKTSPFKFLKILNVSKNQQNKNNAFDYDPAILSQYKKSELLAIVNMKEKEIARMNTLIKHFKKAMEARDNTIMYLNKQIHAMKDLLSLESNFNRNNNEKGSKRQYKPLHAPKYKPKKKFGQKMQNKSQAYSDYANTKNSRTQNNAEFFGASQI